MATQKGRNWSSGDIVTAANLSSIERGVSAVAEEYTPTTWANGDTVTAAALNNIEQGIVNADGGGQTWVTLCEEEVTTEENDGMYGASLSYSQLISADTIRVIFDETTYTCNFVTQSDTITYYGGVGETGPDFSEYPFALVSSSGPNSIANIIYTETPGTYIVKIEALQESGSSDFSTAQVTVTIPSGNETEISIPDVGAAALTVQLITEYNSPFSATVPLYTGVLMIDPHMIDGQVTVVGGGEYSFGTGRITITGDCTITISDSSGNSPK